MFPLQNRLKKKNDFERVFKQGNSARGSLLFLKILNNSKNVSRIGFVVSKKISNKAVVRNKVKRRLRAAAKEELKNYLPGYDMVIVTLPAIKNADYKEIKKDVSLVFKKGYNLK
ncbi:MAG: ribonuclease P protein component [Candidatus Paceibacterota bacterium]